MLIPDALPVAGTAVLVRDSGGGGVEVLMIRRPERGSFADAWVFPGGKVEHRDRRDGSAEIDDARRAAIRETQEEVGLEVDGLTVLSQWHPPAEAPTRIRTWFFLAPAPDATPEPSPEEVVDYAWTTPAEAIERHATGEWTLFPPTWMTLHGLIAVTDAASALAASSAPTLFRTRVIPTDAGRDFAWEQGRLLTDRLPWRFVEERVAE
ncbi:NUDIX hydrolase [Microbacterium sp. NPDC090003]|uniref:NUDIX hydrolase n=1 Tax=Microbacterium sp. NPDC090003 TaxID=3364203 RepID=UPI0037F483D2